jgi:hypothetical protein
MSIFFTFAPSLWASASATKREIATGSPMVVRVIIKPMKGMTIFCNPIPSGPRTLDRTIELMKIKIFVMKAATLRTNAPLTKLCFFMR